MNSVEVTCTTSLRRVYDPTSFSLNSTCHGEAYSAQWHRGDAILIVE